MVVKADANAELRAWKKVWESKEGKQVVTKIIELKKQYLEFAMATANTSEQQVTAINRAQGVNEVLDMINFGLMKANEKGAPAKEE